MSTWVERDARTGEVLLVSETRRSVTMNKAQQRLAGTTEGFVSAKETSRSTLRLKPAQARILAARLLAASDEELEGVVGVVQEVGSVVERGVGLAGAVSRFFRDAERTFFGGEEEAGEKLEGTPPAARLYCQKCLTRRVKGVCPSCEGP